MSYCVDLGAASYRERTLLEKSFAGAAGAVFTDGESLTAAVVAADRLVVEANVRGRSGTTPAKEETAGSPERKSSKLVEKSMIRMAGSENYTSTLATKNEGLWSTAPFAISIVAIV